MKPSPIVWTLSLFLIFGLTSCGASGESGGSTEPDSSGPGLRVGTGSFQFSGSAGAEENPVRVYYHRPESVDEGSPILFVMHGNGRNATGYRRSWIDLADRYGFLLVVPEFSRDHYSSSRTYHQGNIMDASGTPIDSVHWSFVTVEAIFDEVRARVGSTRERYNIYGHSAGSQFVHRMLLLMPEARIHEAVAANAGWYTLPTDEETWPYGLGGVSTEAELQNRLEGALSRKVTVLLGEADTVTTDKDLRTTEEAMAQGEHRFERGHYFYQKARDAAERYRFPFEWELETVPGVAHSNKRMAPAAAAAMSWDP